MTVFDDRLTDEIYDLLRYSGLPLLQQIKILIRILEFMVSYAKGTD